MSQWELQSYWIHIYRRFMQFGVLTLLAKQIWMGLKPVWHISLVPKPVQPKLIWTQLTLWCELNRSKPVWLLSADTMAVTWANTTLCYQFGYKWQIFKAKFANPIQAEPDSNGFHVNTLIETLWNGRKPGISGKIEALKNGLWRSCYLQIRLEPFYWRVPNSALLCLLE